MECQCATATRRTAAHAAMAAPATERKSELRFGKGGWLHKASEYDVVFEFPHNGSEQLYANSFVLRAASPLLEELFGSGAASNAASSSSAAAGGGPCYSGRKKKKQPPAASGDAVGKGPTVFRVDNRTPQQMDTFLAFLYAPFAKEIDSRPAAHHIGAHHQPRGGAREAATQQGMQACSTRVEPASRALGWVGVAWWCT
jgi:hypothetical protein